MYQTILKKMMVGITLLTTVFMLNATEVKAWWSCMYPDVCFRSSIKAVVYEDGNRKEQLEEADYQELSVLSKFKAKCYIWELFE